jgi:hypothetical protein
MNALPYPGQHRWRVRDADRRAWVCAAPLVALLGGSGRAPLLLVALLGTVDCALQPGRRGSRSRISLRASCKSVAGRVAELQ